jgi:hypothetical protein
MKRLLEFLKSHPVVGLDTSIFIYHLEDHPRYAPMTEIIFDSLSPFSPSSWKSPEKPPT